MSHTPGPWKIVADPFCTGILSNNRFITTENAKLDTSVIGEWDFWDGSLICVLRDAHDPHEIAANARLIAAAPKMFAALKSILNSHDDVAREIAREAIAEAKGE